MSARCSANGNDVGGNEIVTVRPGEGGTMRSADAAQVTTFGLQPSLFAREPELDLPFGPSTVPPSSGRWSVASDAPRQRFIAFYQAVSASSMRSPDPRSACHARGAAQRRRSRRSTPLGEAGTFRPRPGDGRPAHQDHAALRAGDRGGRRRADRHGGALPRDGNVAALARGGGPASAPASRPGSICAGVETLAGAGDAAPAGREHHGDRGRLQAGLLAPQPVCRRLCSTFGERPSVTLAKALGCERPLTALRLFAQNG